MSQFQNIQQLVDAKKISAQGADWLRTALDPFHDYRMNLEGFPDQISDLSRVQLKTSTISITNPGAAAYSARIWVTPFSQSVKDTFARPNAVSSTAIDLTNNTDGGDFGIVVADAWSAGVDPNADSTATFSRQAVPASTDGCPGRLIALAVEVHNTTPVLNISGTITCSSLPNRRTQHHCHLHATTMSTGTTQTNYDNVSIHVLPPTASSQAMLVPGSTQWHAKDGGYFVAKLAQPALPVEKETIGTALLSTTNSVASTKYHSGAGFATLSGQLVAVPSTNIREHAFNRPYAILEGLSTETTLQVTIRSYFEYFPSHVDDAFMPFATPSPRLDVAALKVYGATAPYLPMAVPVSMNAKGDYFRLVMKALSQGLRIVGPLLAPISPYAPLIAGAASSAAQILSNKPAAKKNKKKKNQVGWGTVSGSPGSLPVLRK